LTVEHFTRLLAKPQEITSEDLKKLEVILREYPYFQSARALQLKGLKNEESFRYNQALKTTAAHTADRDILFEYITSREFIQNQISRKILQQKDPVDEIEVIAEDISENLAAEKEKEYKNQVQQAEKILNPELFQRRDSLDDEKKPETLHPDSPLPFAKEDKYSFSEWLKLTQAQPVHRDKEKTDTAGHDRTRKFDLIDKFIQENPRISPSRPAGGPDSERPEPAAGIHSPDALMTETLARVYLQQKNYKKAIQAYKILILKNPEKSGYFADQIRGIEKLINPDSQ